MSRPVLAALACLLAAPAAAADAGFATTVFDRPVAQRTLALPSHKPDPARTLRCHYFPGFMVKEVRVTGDIGAEAFAILRAEPGVAPPCQRAAGSQETSVALAGLDQESPGVEFAGAKGDLLFLASSDSVHQAIGFAVVDRRDGKVMFHDWSLSALTFRTDGDGTQRARYRRAVSGECSVFAEGAICAQRIGRASATDAPTLAQCTAGYEAAIGGAIRNDCKSGDAACALTARRNWSPSPSVVSVPSELTITASGVSSRALAPPDRCWPAE